MQQERSAPIRSRRYVWSWGTFILLAVVGGGVLTTLGTSGFRVLDLQPSGTNDSWRLRWTAVPGAVYQLQRLEGDQLPTDGVGRWIPVASVLATNPIALAEDVAGPLVRQRFYRVLQVEPVFKILDVIRVATNEALRICWESVPGLDYQLQRNLGDGLGSGPSAAWDPVTSLRATGTVSCAEDRLSAAVRQRFYRVALLTAGGDDVLPPAIVFHQALLTTDSNGAPALELSFTATDDREVAEVVVREDGRVLGMARWEGGSNWVYTLPVDLDALETRTVSATATDRSGKTGDAAPVGLLPVHPDLFAPVSATGEPLERHALVISVANQIADFVYRPGGRPRPGFAPDFFIRFPDGATLHHGTNREPELEFVRAVGGFDGESPFQLAAPLERLSGAPLRLRVGPLHYTNLVSMFNADPTNGIPLKVFNGFELRWRGGLLDDRGLVGAQFQSAMPDLPLPAWSAPFADHLIDFARERLMRIPFAGNYVLPDKSAIPARLGIPPGRPFWWTLRSDGSMSLEGPVEFVVSSNFNLRAQLRFEDPKYHLSLETPALRYRNLTNLAPLLSGNPAQCLPGDTSLAAAQQAQECFQGLARSYAHFSAAVSGGATSAPPTELPVPEALNAVADVLEAWSYGAIVRPNPTQPLGSVLALAAQTGIQATASPELLEVVGARLALLRCRWALVKNNAPAAALQVVDTALLQADGAAMDRAESAAAGLSLGTLVKVSRWLVESEALRTSNNLPRSVLLNSTLPTLFIALANQLAHEWSVLPGAFTPEANPAIHSMDRQRAMELLRGVAEFQKHARALAYPLNTTPMAELSGQLGVRALQVVEGAMAAGFLARETPAFMGAARDYLELVRWAQSGVLPGLPELATLTSGSGLGLVQVRLANLLQAELERPVRELSLGRWAADLSTLLEVIRGLPDVSLLPKQSLERLYQQVDAQLAARPPGTESNLVHLLEWMEAGNLHRELAQRFEIPPAGDWEGGRLPLVVTQLCVIAKSGRAWRELDRGAALMLDACEHVGLASSLSRELRKSVSGILSVARQAAEGLMADAQSGLRRVDIRLPGEGELDEPAGYVYYHRLSRQVHGAMRGRLKVPAWGLDLTVPNASLGSGGALDLSAFGTLDFEGGRLVVPDRQPLHVRHVPDRGVTLAGGSQLLLDNGLRFDASVAWTDPVYRFALSAKGIEFNLGRELMLQRPALSEGLVKGFQDEARDALADYLRHLNGTVETMITSVGGFPAVDPNGFGRPPEFAAPEITLNFASLNAWSAEVLTRARAGLSQAQLSTMVPLVEAVQRLNREAAVAREAIADERARMAHLAARLVGRRRMKEAVNAMAAPGADFDALLAEVERGLRQEASNVVSLVTPDLADRLPDALDVARLLLETDAGFQMFNLTETDAQLPADPCQAATHAGASLRQRTEALIACAALRNASALGLNPATGAIVDSNKFNALSEVQLEQAMTVLIEMEVCLQQQGSEDTTVLPVATTLVRRQRELLREELTASTNLVRQFELMGLLLDNVAWSQNVDALTSLEELRKVEASITGALAVVFKDVDTNHEQAVRVLDARKQAQKAREQRRRQTASAVRQALGRDRGVHVVGPDAEYTPDFFTQLANFIRLLRKAGATMSAGSLTNVDAFVRGVAADLRAHPFTAEFLTNRLAEAETLLQGVLGLTEWAGHVTTNDFNTLTNLQFSLTNLTYAFNAAAEAQKAWWLLDRYQEVLRRHTASCGTNAVAVLRNALRDSRGASLMAGRRVNNALNTLFSQVHFKDVVVTLPGDVEIRHVYGRLHYDRWRAYLEGCFGGRVEFPEVSTNMFFEITEACLASDGAFSLVSTNATPLPFGGMRLSAGINVEGSAAGVAAFMGNGTLWVPGGPAGDRIFRVALSYDQEAHRMGFDALGQNLSLPFGQDFVLFDAGFGFDVSTVMPHGQFRAHGSAGLIARDPSQPLPPAPNATHFHLVVTNLTAVFSYSNAIYRVGLDNGRLLLPEFFHTSTNGLCAVTNQPPPGPSIDLNPAYPIQVQVVMSDPPQASFTGGLEFRNIGFEVPGLPGVAVDLCSARLRLRTNEVPWFTNLTASIQIPLPNATSRVDILDAAWHVDGFPSGTVRLGQNIPLFGAGNFHFTLLGTNTVLCTNGTGVSIHMQTNGVPRMTLFGAVGVGIDESSLSWADGTKMTAEACGSVVVDGDGLPDFHLDGLGLAGTFRLGGSGGVVLQEARLDAMNVDRLFQPPSEDPFRLKLSGTIVIPYGPGLVLSNANFTFANGAPWFSVQGLTLIDPPDWLASSLGGSAGVMLASAPKTHKYEPVEGLGLDVSAVGIFFLDPHLRLPQLLDPSNIRLTVSAMLNLPPENPLFVARVDGLTLHWTNDTLQASLTGVGLGFDNLEFPPLTLKGMIYVGGINPEDAFHSPNLFFAGQVGGKIEDVGAIATLAVTPRGILGVCLDVNAGPAGIPIDGGALGGVLLTGAAGGVTFTNATDPCDFMSYITIPGGAAPAGADPGPLPGLQPASLETELRPLGRLPPELIGWDALAAVQRRDAFDAQLALAPAPLTLALEDATTDQPDALAAGAQPGPGAPCILEPCPPPTISLLCQPHPDQDRYSNHVIIKFTSLGEAQLNGLGITRELITTFGSTAEQVGQNVAGLIRQSIDGLLPRAETGGLLDAQQVFAINAGITNLLDDIQGAFAGILSGAVQGAMGNQDQLYQAVLDAAYAGVPCPSVVVKLTGTLSHAAVSTFLSGTVGTILSTDGSAGVVGSVNLIGIPVGKVRGFVAGSDARGNPNPSFCGQMEAALGPLEMGVLQALYSCDGCSDGLAAAFVNLAGCLGQQADLIIHDIAGKVAPDLDVGPLTSLQILQALAENPTLMAAFMGELFRYPNLPPDLPACFLQAMGEAWDSMQPQILVCGEAQPKLFGLPLMGEVGSVYLEVTKGNITARAGMSPTYVIGNTLLCLGTSGMMCQGVFPALDEGSVGFGLNLPDPVQFLLAGLSGQLASPEAVAAYVEDSFAYMLQEGTFTLTYKLNPFGFEIANAQGRVILPDLTQHPACAGGYVRPEDRGLPSRLDLLLWANATNLLGNPAWKGDTNTLAWAFPEGDPRRAQLAGLTLNRDYFPYGGIAGALWLQLPKALVNAPPPVLGRIFENRPVLERLGAAAEYLTGYVLAGTNVGSLAFYLPAPNPPCLPDLPTPRQLLEAMADFDPLAVAPPDLYPEGLYPLSEGFMQGYLDGRLLGVPILQATVELVPPEGDQQGYFLGRATVPPDSWMSNFLDSASATFEIRQSPALPINLAFENLLAEIQQATNSGNQALMDQLASGLGGFLTTNLPKVALQVAVSNLHIPDPLTNLITASASAHFYAFSPWYDPGTPGTGPVADARRNGGIALQGQLEFADYVTVDNAELAVAIADGVPVPALSGVFGPVDLDIPGLPLREALFSFNSDPPVGQAYLAANGEIDPIVFLNPITSQPLLAIRNLTNAGARIAASFSLRRAPNRPPLPGFRISPSSVDMPMLGPWLAVRVHGATTNDAFTFSSTGSWTGQVSMAGQLRLQGPLGTEVARIGSAGQQFSALLIGDGMEMERLAVTLPSGIAVTVFPNDPAVSQTFTLGNPGGTNRLEIASDGTFLLHGELGGTLNLSGLGFSSISSGASVTLSESALTISGQINGGALDHVDGLPSAQGQFTVTPAGVSLSGSVSVPAFTMGVFMVSGGNGGAITATLNNEGLFLDSGAWLRLLAEGYPNQDLFRLRPLTITANGDFNVTVQSGTLYLPGYFSLTGGTFTLRRASGVATLSMHLPTMTLFPNASFPSTSISAPFTDVTMSSNGRFYANTGSRSLTLPGGFSASGQLEIGYEPDPREPQLSVSTSPISFGTVNYGSSASRSLTIGNPGDGLLNVTLTSAQADVFSVTPFDLTVEPGQSRTVSVRFTPNAAGDRSSSLTILHNASGASPNIPVSGTGRAVAVLRPSATSLNFGEVKVNELSTMLLRIDNLGLITLNGSCSVTSGQFSVSPASFSVAPGGYALLTVTFAPTSSKYDSATLQLASNDPNSPATVTLSGTGYSSSWYLQREGGQKLNVIAMNSVGRGFAAGEGGQLLYTVNSGDSWAPGRLFRTLQMLQEFKKHSDPITWRGGAMADDGTHGIVVGHAGRVYLTSDRGETWIQHQHATATNGGWKTAAFLPGTVRHVLVGGRMREWLPGLWREENVIAVAQNDGGTSYSIYYDALLQDYNCVATASVSGQSILLVGTDNGKILRSVDAGGNWSVVTLDGGAGNITGVALKANGVALLVTDTGRIYQSSNSGASWPTMIDGKGTLQAVAFRGNTYAHAVNREGEIHRSYSSGGNSFSVWTKEEAGLGEVTSVAANASLAWCAGAGSRIYHRSGYSLNYGFLTFEPASLNYGFVRVGDSVPRVLTLYNRGQATLTVSGFAPTLSGFSSELVYNPAPSIAIPAGGKVDVSISYRPTTTNDVATELVIFSNDPTGNSAVRFSGRAASHGWVLKNNMPGTAGDTAVNVQMVTDTAGYALMSDGQLFKTLDGGVTWTAMAPPTSSPKLAMHWASTTTGLVGGGTMGVANTSYIMRTTDGGAKWTTVYSSSRTPIKNIHCPDATYGYAVTDLGPGKPEVSGVVLRTANGGASWTERTVPVGLFNGEALHAVSSTELFASSGATLYRSADSAATWTTVVSSTATLRDVYFPGSLRGYVVGDSGTMWRTEIGGDSAAEWFAVSLPTSWNLNAVHFVSFYDGWITASSAAAYAALWRSRDGGASWQEELSQSPYAGPGSLKPTVVWSRSADLAVALGTDGCVRRYEPFLSDPVGIATAPPVLDFGTASLGQEITRTFTLRNVGTKNLVVSRFSVNGAETGNTDFKVTTSLPMTLSPGSGRTVSVVAFNRAAGPVSAELTIDNDGIDPSVSMELRSQVPLPPAVIAFTTDPPGMTLRIDGATLTAPVAYTIVEHSAGSGEWLAGTAHTIEALASQNVAGQEFAFVDWVPAESRVFTCTAAMASRTYTATYVPTTAAGAGGAAAGEALPAAEASPPPGIQTGPYVRLSNATMTAPALGNFTASGAALLSADLMDVSLTTTPLLLRPNPSTIPLAEIHAAAWRFLHAGGTVKLSAQTPSLKLVGNAVTPPSSLELIYDSAGHFRGTFSLPQGWKVAPSLLEFGSSSLTLAHTNFFYLSCYGQARALRKPDGNWAYQQNRTLTFRDGPFTNSVPLADPLFEINLPGSTMNFLRTKGGATSSFELRRDNSGNVTAELKNLGLEVMGLDLGRRSLSVSTSGNVSYAATPSAPFRIGSFGWSTTGSSHLDWNIKNGALSFTLAGGTLANTYGLVAGWPGAGLSFPTVTFDSQGDFYQKITLPSVSFDGIALGQADDENDRYVVFKRVNGVLTCALRDQREFFGSTMSIGFDIHSSGSSSGFFKGSFGVDFPAPLGRVEFGNVNLTYNSGGDPYQFDGQVRVLANDFRIQFGSGGGRVCHLWCGSSTCNPAVCVP